MDYKRNHLVFSSADRRNGGSGSDGIYRIDLNDSDNSPQKVLDNYPGQLYPHGIFVLEQDSTTYIFVVNHQKTGDYIEKFIYNGQAIEHISSYTHTLIQGANDVAALHPDLFYVTRDHGFVNGWKRTLEDYLILPLAKVIKCDMGNFTIAADGLQYANGINYSADKSTLYVAETTGRTLRIYNIGTDHELILEQKIATGTGVDNIDVDEDGKLWIGCHPKLLAFVAHAKEGKNLSPSQIIRIDPTEDYRIEEVVMDDGSAFSGCSTALYHNRILYAGVVFDPVIWRGKLN